MWSERIATSTIHEILHRLYGLNVSLMFPRILWRLIQLLEERRLKAAAETLDSLQREMNLAAEHALAMEEQQQHHVGHAYDSRRKALAAQADCLAESTGAAGMSPAAAADSSEVPAAGSLTHRITSIEQIIATAEIQAQDRCDLRVKIWTRPLPCIATRTFKTCRSASTSNVPVDYLCLHGRHLAERLAPPSPPPLTGKRPRPKFRTVTRLVSQLLGTSTSRSTTK